MINNYYVLSLCDNKIFLEILCFKHNLYVAITDSHYIWIFHVTDGKNCFGNLIFHTILFRSQVMSK